MIHVSNIGEIIDIQCKKDVKKVELSYFLFGGMGENKAPPPALCFPRFAGFTNSDLWFSEEGGEWLVVEMEGVV